MNSNALSQVKKKTRLKDYMLYNYIYMTMWEKQD